MRFAQLSSLTVNGTSITGGGVSVSPFSMSGSDNGVNSCGINITAPNNSYSSQNINFTSAYYSSYNNYIFSYTNPYWGGGWSFRCNNTVTSPPSSTSRYTFETNGPSFALTTRTGGGNNYDIMIHGDQGVVSIGKGNLLNSNHRMEVNGSLMISDSSNTYTSLPNAPALGVMYSSHPATTRRTYMQMGRCNSSTDDGAWTWSIYYQGSSQGANYLRMSPSNWNTDYNLQPWDIWTQDGRRSISDGSTTGVINNPYTTLDIYGGRTIFIGANGALQPVSGSPAA